MRGRDALTLPGTHTLPVTPPSWQQSGALLSSVARIAQTALLWMSRWLQGLPQPAAAAAAGEAKDAACARWLDTAMTELGDINIYHIYADICTAGRAPATNSGRDNGSSSYQGALLGQRPQRRRGGTISSSSSYGGGGSSGDQLTGQQLRHHQRYDPCVDGAVEAYLNLPEASLAVRCCMTLFAPQLLVDASSCALLLHTHQRTQKNADTQIDTHTEINAHTHMHTPPGPSSTARQPDHEVALAVE